MISAMKAVHFLVCSDKLKELAIPKPPIKTSPPDAITECLDIIHCPVFLLRTQSFLDWDLSLSLGKSLLS
jgi:hypothetical protein